MGDHLTQGRQPGEVLVIVVLGARLAAVRHIDRVNADAAAGGRQRSCL